MEVLAPNVIAEEKLRITKTVDILYFWMIESTVGVWIFSFMSQLQQPCALLNCP